jgi:hypothetical protein
MATEQDPCIVRKECKNCGAKIGERVEDVRSASLFLSMFLFLDFYLSIQFILPDVIAFSGLIDWLMIEGRKEVVE